MTTQSRRVLVVDDEPDIREMLGKYLMGLGYEVLLADTSLGALEMVSTHSPDVVLLDLAMPDGVHGEAVITRISREAPVIVITGMDIAEVARDALDGAFDFVMKPFTLSRVREVLEAALAKGGESAT